MYMQRPNLPDFPRLRDAAHWQRKHMGDIAWAVKQYAARTTLTHRQRELASRAHDLAHALATGAAACCAENAARATTAFCAFCTSGVSGTSSPGCRGREDWRQPCALLLRMAA